MARLKAEVGAGDAGKELSSGGDAGQDVAGVAPLGLGDVLFGRKKLKEPAADRLFAIRRRR